MSVCEKLLRNLLLHIVNLCYNNTRSTYAITLIPYNQGVIQERDLDILGDDVKAAFRAQRRDDDDY